MNASITKPPAWLARTLIVTTPEAVDFEYELAGPGHRLLAWIIDAVIVLGLLFLAAVIGLLIGLALGLPGLGKAVLNTLMFLASTFYFMGCEHFMNGQTPGKKVAGIRVLDARGFRITFAQSAIRNLFRFIDGLPIFYAVGGTCMLLNRNGLRLGDLAAGTVVVRVPRIPAPDRILPAGQREESLLGDFALGERVRRVLRAPEKDLLVSLAVRRDRLEERARLKVFEQASSWFETRLEVPRPRTMSAETYVLNLAAIAHAPRDRAAAKGAAR